MKTIVKIPDISIMSFLQDQYPHYQVLYFNRDNLKDVYRDVVSIDFFDNHTHYFLVDEENLLHKEITPNILQLLNLLNDEVFLFTTSSLHSSVIDEVKDVDVIEPDFKIKNLIVNYIHAHHINIEADALDLLLFNLEDNYLLTINELDKLSLIDTPITVARINAESYKTTTANSFSLVDNVILNNIKAANKIANELLEDNFSEVGLLTFVYNQVSQYLLCKILLRLYRPNSVQATLKVSDYRFKQMRSLVSQITEQQLCMLIQKLHEVEIQLKYS